MKCNKVIRILILFFTVMICDFCSLNAQKAALLADLPLEFTVSHGTHDELIIYVTGDGGWNSFNGQMVHQMEQLGYGVIALNSRKYFWSEKSPDAFAGDIENLTEYYLQLWKKGSVIIVGYSFGADVVSFLPTRFPKKMNDKIKKIALISPSSSTDFVIRLSDLIGETENMSRRYKVKPEIEQIGLPVACTFGKEETKALKGSLNIKKNLTIIELPGDHRYQNNFLLLINTLLGS